MTVVELVERERARLRRLHVLVGLALAIGATCLLLAAGASALGGARWMRCREPCRSSCGSLVLAADVAVVLWTVRRLDRRTTRHSVAAAIEREQLLRAGSLRGVIEVADSGALGRRAAATLSERLGPRPDKLAVGERRLVRRGAAQATGAATMAVAALAFAAPNFNDGMLAILQPVSAWQGTLLPRHRVREPAARRPARRDGPTSHQRAPSYVGVAVAARARRSVADANADGRSAHRRSRRSRWARCAAICASSQLTDAARATPASFT